MNDVNARQSCCVIYLTGVLRLTQRLFHIYDGFQRYGVRTPGNARGKTHDPPQVAVRYFPRTGGKVNPL